jgi:hypothetical protein
VGQAYERKKSERVVKIALVQQRHAMSDAHRRRPSRSPAPAHPGGLHPCSRICSMLQALDRVVAGAQASDPRRWRKHQMCSAAPGALHPLGSVLHRHSSWRSHALTETWWGPFAECQGLVGSAGELYDVSRIVRFLDNWRIINYLAVGSVHGGWSMATSLLTDEHTWELYSCLRRL